MKLPAKIVVGLAPLFLTACFHHNRPVAQTGPLAPVIVDSPPPPPSTAPVGVPGPEATIPAQPTKTAPTPPKTPPRQRKPRPVTSTPANPPPQEAAIPTPAPVVSAIGELSSGDPANYRQQTAESIASIERGLNGINRPLSDSEQKTADNIREFLKQAKAALASGDVDGAHTLAVKAKILLAELTQ